MRFLSLIHPPKDRLVRQDMSTPESEWRKQWRQIQHMQTISNEDFWTPQQMLTMFCVVLLLVALFILFSHIK
jgi:hypothetical protein